MKKLFILLALLFPTLAATDDTIRFPEFQQRCDDFLRRLNETVDVIKTKRLYVTNDTLTTYRDRQDDLISRCNAVEELFHSHEWAWGRGEKLYELSRAELADDVDRPRFRLCVARMWLAYIRAMADSLDTEFTQKPIYLNLSVEGMMHPAGVAPEAIDDPEVRARYEAALIENTQNHSESKIQFFTIRRELHHAVQNGMDILQNMYRADAGAKAELAQLLTEYDFPFTLMLDRIEMGVNRDVTPLPPAETESPSFYWQAKLLVALLEFDDFTRTDGWEERLARGIAIWKTIVAQAEKNRSFYEMDDFVRRMEKLNNSWERSEAQ